MNMIPLPLAERYERFRDSVFATVEESPTLMGLEAPMSELDLQSLWFSGAFGTTFQTSEGRDVVVEDFGVWNAGAGPDFTGCAVRVGGVLLKGDVELDPDARDWERHQHGANPDYQNVVLHVFMEAPAEQRFFTRTHQHTEVAQTQISRAMLAADAAPKSRLAAARLGRCALPLRDMQVKHVSDLIESAAQHRLRLKSNRLHKLVAAHGREQAIFQTLAQTLGYRKNQQPFVVLAQRLTVKRLLKEDSLNRQAMLFGVSGFLEAFSPDQVQSSTRTYLKQLWSRWWKLRESCLRWLEPQHTLRWKLSAVRPGNHPQRRLGALAVMLDKWPQVSTPLDDATRWSLPAWREVMLNLQHEFWTAHYTLAASPSDKPIALIGETRVQEMLANVVYPLLVPERTRLWAEYLELPALLDNQKVRRAMLRLFGDASLAKDFNRKLFHHQGILQIYEDFCLEDHSSCAECPFPERLKEWA
jgi:hypothetical protein